MWGRIVRGVRVVEGAVHRAIAGGVAARECRAAVFVAVAFAAAIGRSSAVVSGSAVGVARPRAVVGVGGVSAVISGVVGAAAGRRDGAVASA